MDKKNKCSCCSGRSYEGCCEKYITLKSYPKTPLELMRSRYTAFVLKDMDYIERTMAGKALKTLDREATVKERFDSTKWIKLEIVDFDETGKEPSNRGIVEFKAHYEEDGNSHILHERSKFQKIDKKWYYISGIQKNNDIVKDEKIGRNDLCSCESGKKYKKCCGLKD